MSNATAAFSIAAMAVSVATGVGVLVRGWRNRIAAAAARPFLTGQAAVDEAETALRLKDRRLGELTQSEASLTAKLAAAVGTAEAQQEQLVKLQSEMYRLSGENRDLLHRAEVAETRERDARDRIGQLEETVEDLKRKLALGGAF